MKLKINKACDLNSISVLPPHSRRSSLMPVQPQPQPQPQPRSQPSQQSFSQGLSSQQNAMFSQISQNSFDEFLSENQRFGSDNSVKRLSCLAPNSYPREESQLPISRSSSANLTRRWNSTVPDHKCQLNDELEHKFATMETLLSRLGMILDSVQSDIMQVNKGTKELSLAVEGIRQKLIARDDSLHLLNRGQEEMKTSLDVGLRSFSNQLNNIAQTEKMQEIMSTVMTLPDQIQGIVHKQGEELSGWLSEDLKAIFFSLNTLNQKHLPLAILAPKVTGGDSSVQVPLFTKVTGGDSSMQQPLFRSETQTKTTSNSGHLGPKNKSGGWMTVKPDQSAVSNRHENTCRNTKQRRISPLAKPPRIVVSLDDDSDDDFSCIIVEKELDDLLVDEEAEQILRKARRRKRKQDRKTSS